MPLGLLDPGKFGVHASKLAYARCLMRLQAFSKLGVFTPKIDYVRRLLGPLGPSKFGVHAQTLERASTCQWIRARKQYPIVAEARKGVPNGHNLYPGVRVLTIGIVSLSSY